MNEREAAGANGRMAYLARLVLFAAIYFAAAKVALLLAIPPGYATPVWPASGIALAAALLVGNRIWPGIWLGAALANLTIEASPATAALIATGNTLEALAGAALVRRFIGVPRRFERGEDVVTFVAAAALSATVAATVGILPVAYTHTLSAADILANWWTWWQGDVSGIIVVAPLVLSWSARPDTAWPLARKIEAACFAVLLAAIAHLAFAGAAPSFFPMKFLTLPFIIWAAFRFGQREVTTAIAVVSALAVWSTLDAAGGAVSVNESLLLLLAFHSTIVVTGLVLCAVLHEREGIARELRRKNDELETSVQSRTLALSEANRALREDIEDRAKAQRALRESEHRSRAMIESIADYAIFMLDPEGRVTSWNAGAQRLKGYTAEEITGRHFSTFYLPEDVAGGKPRETLRKALAEGRCVDEGWRKRKDGSRFWASVVVTAIRDTDGRLIGLSKVTRDLSERKRAEIQMEDARVAAEQANRAKSEFLAKMSHELRTPLNSLLILARLLSDNVNSNLSPKQVQYAQTIYGAGMDLLALINDILDLSRIESGAVIDLTIAPARFTELQDYVESTFRQVARHKGLEFAITIDERLPAEIHTDLRRLQQILKNLLANAFKFTREGGVSLDIFPADSGWARGHPRLDAAETVVAFSVMDTGIGIASGKQGLIFEAFQQADSTTSRQFGGTGLGLSISREFTRLMGGDIRVDSSPGRGSTFTLYLPLAYQTPPDIAADPAETSTAS